MNKILLTGSSGFIGSKFLQQCSVPVVEVLRSTQREECTRETFLVSGLDNSTTWEGAFCDVDTIVHLAGVAHSPNGCESEFQRVNVEGTAHLAKCAAKAGVKRFVFLSSIGVLGDSTSGVPFSNSSSYNPQTAYTRSKRDAEIELKKIEQDTDLEVVIIRPPLVYGHGARGNFSMLVKMVNLLPILPFGLVNNKRDFVSVENLVDLILCCCVHPNSKGKTFLVSDSQPISLKAFTLEVSKGLGGFLVHAPIPLVFLHIVGSMLKKNKVVGQLLDDLEIDIYETKERLNWAPPYSMRHTMMTLKGNEND